MRKSYIDWIESDGYWSRDTWDDTKKRMKGLGKMMLFPEQRRVMAEALSMDEEGLLKYETVMYSCPKKSGKTAVGGSVGAWYAECGPDGTEIFVIANTLEQGEGRLMRDIKFHFEQRIMEGKYSDKANSANYVKITQYRIDLPNGTFIQALAQSYKAVAGSRHALTLWDELWGTTSELDRRVWDEMTPIPTVQNSLRFISTYAGFENESELLWEMYLRGVGIDEHDNGRAERIEGMKDIPVWANGRLFTYWTHEPTMPWQTTAYYEEQMQSERPSAFLRLHLNQWVTSQESFIPVEWVDAAAKHYKENAERWIDHPFKYWPITIGLDAGIKQDCTALVGVGYDAKRAKVGLAFHTIWVPHKDAQIDLDEVEKRLVELYNKFTISSIVYDPTHLMQMMYKLRNRGLPVKPFEQTQMTMTAASQLLFDLFKNKNIEMYPTEDLRKHLQMAVAETSARGFRIVKGKVSKLHHVDGAVAMAMACYDAVSNGGADISIPTILESPFSDMSAFNKTDDEAYIPPQLRS
jgi:phage terminase large subunit-like protein